jgi:nucleotide-binding universal stress UspA family protein
MCKRILVPLDGSELAKKALDHADKLAETFGSEIILFQVVPFMPVFGAPELMTSFTVDEKQKEAAERYLTNLSEELKKRGFKVMVKVKAGQQVGRRDYKLCKGKRSRFDRDVHARSFCNHPMGPGEFCPQGRNAG